MEQLGFWDIDDQAFENMTPIKSSDWKWTFADYPKQTNGIKVFSCFACGGGQLWAISSLGARWLDAAR